MPMFFFVLGFTYLATLHAAPLSVSVAAEAAILFNPTNNRILFAKEPYAEHYPASMTKVATALWALKLKPHDLDEAMVASGESVASVTEEAKRRSNYTLPSWWLVPGASHIGIKKGEVLSFRDLLYGMMLASGDDAANVIAEHLGPGIEPFMKGLNSHIQSLGCKHTHFENPHGLFHPRQKTCAYDMALIMKEALKEPFFRTVIGTVTYTRPKTNKQPASTLVQTNRLMRAGPFYYPKAIGGKTGHLALAQNTFVAAAKDQDRTLIAVFLKTKERSDLWRDAIKLFETAFNQPLVERVYLKAGIQNYTLMEDSFNTLLTTYTAQDAKLTYYPAEEPIVKGFVFWDELMPPISKGRKVGELKLIDERGEVLSAIPLLAGNEVSSTFFFTLKLFFTSGSILFVMFKWLLVVMTLGGLIWLYATRGIQKAR